MPFDEAIKYANENSFVEEMLSDVVELEDVIEILEKLKTIQKNITISCY